MQNFGLTNKEHLGMLWYFLEKSIPSISLLNDLWRLKYANFSLFYTDFLTIVYLIKRTSVHQLLDYLHSFGNILLLLTVPIPFRHYLSVIRKNWSFLFH